MWQTHVFGFMPSFLCHFCRFFHLLPFSFWLKTFWLCLWIGYLIINKSVTSSSYELYKANLLISSSFFTSCMLNPRFILQMKYLTAQNFVDVSQFYGDYTFCEIFLTKSNFSIHFWMNFQQNQSLLCLFDLIPKATIEAPFTKTKVSFTWVFYLNQFA